MKYYVNIERSYYDIEVEADDELEAESKAKAIIDANNSPDYETVEAVESNE
jgi:hypothetical protein